MEALFQLVGNSQRESPVPRASSSNARNEEVFEDIPLDNITNKRPDSKSPIPRFASRPLWTGSAALPKLNFAAAKASTTFPSFQTFRIENASRNTNRPAPLSRPRETCSLPYVPHYADRNIFPTQLQIGGAKPRALDSQTERSSSQTSVPDDPPDFPLASSPTSHYKPSWEVPRAFLRHLEGAHHRAGRIPGLNQNQITRLKQTAESFRQIPLQPTPNSTSAPTKGPTRGTPATRYPVKPSNGIAGPSTSKQPGNPATTQPTKWTDTSFETPRNTFDLPSLPDRPRVPSYRLPGADVRRRLRECEYRDLLDRVSVPRRYRKCSTLVAVLVWVLFMSAWIGPVVWMSLRGGKEAYGGAVEGFSG